MKKQSPVKRLLIWMTVLFMIIIITVIGMTFFSTRLYLKKTVTPEDVSEFLSQDQILSDPMSGFSRLSEDEQRAYLRIEKEIQSMPEDLSEDHTLTADLDGNIITVDSLTKVYKAIMQDHPEYFWVNNYAYTYLPDTNEVQQITINSSMSREEIAENRQKLNDWSKTVLEGLPGGDYKNALYLHDYIVDHTEYDREAPNNQNLISVVDGASVCAGYAEAYQYLMNQAGYFATTVSGVVGGDQPHAWNLVKLGDEYGWIDPTWNDPGFGSDEFKFTSHQFFGTSTNDLLKTHSFDTLYSHIPVLPEPSWNYFRSEGLDFDLNEPFTTTQIIGRLRKAGESGLKTIMLRLKSTEQVDELLSDLSYNSISSDYTLTYVRDEHYPILMFIF